MRKIDYGHWESIVEEEEKKGIEQDIQFILDQIICQKEEADLVFDSSLSLSLSFSHLSSQKRKEKEIDCYHRSLQMYLDIISQLSPLPQVMTHPNLTNIFISCRLNSACCYSKLKKWKECIEVCQDLLDSKLFLLTSLQQLRCHYFLANATFENSKEESRLQTALQSSTIIQNLLTLPEVQIHEEDRAEYLSLHRKITMHLYDKSEGWKLLSQNRSLEALQWFADAIQRTPDSSDSTNLLVLANYFQGLGESYERMSHYPKASMAFEKVVELTAKETNINQLDLLTQDTCQKFITKGAFNAFRAASHLFLSTEGATSQDTKDEFLSMATRSIDLFQRLINFSESSQLHRQFPYLTLYSIVGHYGLGCNFFLLSKIDQSINHFESCITQISQYLSSNNNTEENLLVSLPDLFLTSESLFLDLGISLLHQPPGRYEARIRSKQISPIKKYLISFQFHFLSFLSSLPVPPFQFSARQIEQICYSFLFDSYMLCLYILTISKKYSELIQRSDDFLCWIGKCHSYLPESKSHESLLEVLTLGNGILKLWGNNHLDCVDIDIQEYLYSSLLQHSQKIQSIQNSERNDQNNHLSHLLFICAEHYFQNSKIQLFHLDDKILHTENYELAEVAQQVVEVCNLAIKEYEKYIHQLATCRVNKLLEEIAKIKTTVDQGLVSESLDLLSQIHCNYIDLLKIHLWRGMCGSSRIQGQRYFECGHSTREEYDRLRIDSRYQEIGFYLDSAVSSSQVKSNDIMDSRPLWKNEYRLIHGDISFHLAYTYMRSGKIKYAIEEGRKSVKLFESLTPLDSNENFENYNSNLEKDKKLRLRQAWGLVAVIACNMGDNPEAREESQSALKMIKEMDVGPLQDSSQELAKLTHILDLNRHQELTTPQETHSKKVLLENWRSVNPVQLDSVPIISEKKLEMIPKTISPSKIDHNLLLSYYILSSIASFFLFLLVFALFPQIIS